MSSVSSVGAAPPVHHVQHKSETAQKPPAKTEQHEEPKPAAKPSQHKVDVKA